MYVERGHQFIYYLFIYFSLAQRASCELLPGNIQESLFI